MVKEVWHVQVLSGHYHKGEVLQQKCIYVPCCQSYSLRQNDGEAWESSSSFAPGIYKMEDILVH